jgi:eukaryotic-like serine/threonine-protein kinase
MSPSVRRVGRAFAHDVRTHTTKGLSPDLLRDASRRLAIAGLMYAIAFTLSLALNLMFLHFGWARAQAYAERTVVRVISLVLGLGVFLYARRAGLSPERVTAIGLLFEIVGGLLIVWPENSMLVQGPAPSVIGISWLAVWVTIFPMLLPARPRVTIAASLVTATMSPLSIWLLTRAGHPTPPVSTLTFTYVPNYVAALLAMGTSLVLHRMRGQIAEARALGSYELVERLGAGGMGEVWRASHRMLARPAAIKLIAPDAMAGARGTEAEELVKRFEREAQATASLSSPHTVALYDFGVTEDGTFYYVMELLHGIDLQRLVERFGPLPPERAIALLVQACASLDEAHARGLVHRDIKPANVFTCVLGGRHDFAKVLDFGLVAREAGPEGIDARLTQADAIRGTPAFMAPEMASGARVDGRADLYALGCVAYWLVAGAYPFESRSVYELVSKHMYETPEPPSKRAPQPIPQELDALVLRCLAKAPEARPASACELSALLAAIPVAAHWTEPRAAQWWGEHLA